VVANAAEINKNNPSPAELVLQHVDPTIFVVDDSNKKNLIGTGEKKIISFKPRESTTFKMDFFVYYSPSKKYGTVNDPTLNELIQLCINPPPGRVTKIQYQADVDIASLRWIPFKPKLTGELNINCPFQEERWTEFVEAITGNVRNK
jgi:hypothetical protein